jgi:glycosyltransferase involved in cell wall biosynthesis
MTDLATGLVERGHEVTVFTTDVLDADERARPLREQLSGVRVERFPNLSNSLAWRAKKYLPPGLVLATARRISQFDVVHATDARTLATATAYLAARLAGVPFVLSAHGSLPGSSGVRGAVKDVYDRALVRPMLERASLLLAQTAHEERLYRSAGGHEDTVRLLPLPLDLSSLPDTFDTGFLRRLARVEYGTPIVLFLGRIHHLKGLDILAEAMPDDADLVVVGRDDGVWDEISARHPRARFVGPLYGVERFHAYADADVFALTPRHWEETSVAALEAGASGTALVLTEQTDIPGLSESGGGIVTTSAPDAVREALTSALPRSAEMGERARELVWRQHDRNAVVKRLEGYLARAVSA